MNHHQIQADLEKRLIRKRIMHGGIGEIPSYKSGGKLTFHYQTRLCDEERTLIDDSKASGHKPMELLLGKQFKLEVWETLLQTMRVQEVSEFMVTDIKDTAVYPTVSKSLRDIRKGANHQPSHHCCGMMMDGGTGYTDLNELMRQPQPLFFIMELLSYVAPEDFEKETWTMTTDEKSQLIPRLKADGNDLYKVKRYREAQAKYEEALGLLEQLAMMEKPGDEDWIEVDKRKIPFLLNFSQCKLLDGDFYTVITHTTDVLKKDYASESDRVKALYRRGKAHAAVWDVQQARDDLTQAADLDPSLSKSVAKELKDLEDRVKEKEKQEKASLQGLFA